MASMFQRPLLVASIVTATAAVASAQNAELFNLGSGMTPNDASRAGLVVVGGNGFTGEYFAWSEATGAMDIGGAIAGNGIGGVPVISDDAMDIAGTSLNDTSGFYELSHYDPMTGVWTPLGGIGGSSGVSISSGWGISGDGDHIVGLGWVDAGDAHAVQSTDGMPLMDLGSTVMDRSTRANAVNHDGTVVVGWQDSPTGFRQGAVWVNGVQTIITNDVGDPVGEASAVSANGEWVVGIGVGASMDQGWRWSAATGLEPLGSLGLSCFPFCRGFATAVSGDGSMVLGFDRGFGPPTGGEGWIWTTATGLMSLDDYLADLGLVNPDNVRFSLPLGISSDAKTFVGAGRSDTAFSTGWVVKLSTALRCRAGQRP